MRLAIDRKTNTAVALAGLMIVLCTIGAGQRALAQSPGAAQPAPPAAATPKTNPKPPTNAVPAPQKTVGNPLLAIKSWGYQLRGVEPAEVARSAYDVVVIDYAQHNREFTAGEIRSMRTKPDGTRRYLLAYLSIGEAERYRFYWKPEWYVSPPAWIGPENPEWKGNFPVRYWDLAWQKVIFGEPASYLDRILRVGFDGAYLDRVDVYNTWEEKYPQAKRQMMDFVAGMAAYAKYRQPDFLIVPQNAEELLEDDLYLRSIDAIAKEDLLFGLDHTEAANAKDEVAFSIEQLQRAKRGGKAVLVVEYICRKLDIARAERRLRQELGFVPYTTLRTLHRLGMGEEDYCVPATGAGRRVALVIGNSDYQHVPRLSAPTLGAKAFAAALRRLGFNDVRERLDLSLDGLDHELQRFADTARGADWAVVYYAGLGLAFDGTSYLLPVDARLERPASIGVEAVALERAMQAVQPATQLRLVLADACRANAFLERLQKRGLTQPAGPGIESGPAKLPVLVGLASRCLEPLADIDGKPGAYTAALLQHLETPGLEVPWLMERVRDSVQRASQGRQEPVTFGPSPEPAASFQPVATAVTAPASTAPAKKTGRAGTKTRQ